MDKTLTPKETVSILDRFVVGQNAAKKAVAVALRSRWRRKQVDKALREEITPKNILMIGPTGVGKTEIARRLAKIVHAPFLKVDATKFTEVGYVGRDVEQIVRDLLDVSIRNTRKKKEEVLRKKAQQKARAKILLYFVGESASEETRKKFEAMLDNHDLDEKEIDIEITEVKKQPMVDMPGMFGQVGMLNLNDLMGGGTRKKKRRMPVPQAMEALVQEELNELLDNEEVIDAAIADVEENGIVFIDEIDKVCLEEGKSGSVSREGVQRDLLPIVEGTSVVTKHGVVKTDYILFIASGAFHLSKPSDLLPELQGRLHNRVEMQALTEEDFNRILTEPESNLIEQYTQLLKTEGVTLNFTDDGVKTIARMACKLNDTVENIGARRLQTLMERVLEHVSFEGSELSGQSVDIDAAYVEQAIGSMDADDNLTKFIL